MVILITLVSQVMLDGIRPQRRHGRRPLGRLRAKEVTTVTPDDDAAHLPGPLSQL